MAGKREKKGSVWCGFRRLRGWGEWRQGGSRCGGGGEGGKGMGEGDERGGGVVLGGGGGGRLGGWGTMEEDHLFQKGRESY